MMKKSIFKPVFVFATLLLLAASVSSCNKGYGCPTNFKAIKVLQAATSAIEVIQ